MNKETRDFYRQSIEDENLDCECCDTDNRECLKCICIKLLDELDNKDKAIKRIVKKKNAKIKGLGTR